jgi:Mg-chelatase subunit ChlD
MKRLLFLLTLWLIPAPAMPQGILIPENTRFAPFPRPLPGPHPLRVRSLEVETRIQGQVATTRVTEIFSNDLDFPVDGTFFYPFPEDATFVEFSTWEGEKRLRGEVLEREEARNRYLAIVRRCWDPGLLEYAGSNLFQARIFPVPARGDKRVDLVYSQILKADHGLVSFAYPLESGTRANPQPLGRVRLSVDIESEHGVKTLYSPSHTVDVERRSEKRATARFQAADSVPDRRFQLFYSLSDADFGLSLLTFRESGDSGYFMILLSPRMEAGSREVAPKDILFVLDTSGSMQDRGKIDKAKAALRFGIGSLHNGDRFNIVTFSSDTRKFRDALVTASEEQREAARRFVDNQVASGGTNISEALRDALEGFQSGDRPRYVVFVTDGLPTVGDTDPGKILREASRLNSTRARLFTFGVGYDVNTFLLDQLAARNYGAADYVAPEEDLEVKLSNFFEKLSSPVLTDLALDLEGIGASDFYPRQMPDLFRGSQVTILGRYSGTANVPLVLRGRVRGETRTFRFESNRFPAAAAEHDFLPRLWAMRKVGFLLEQIRMSGENAEIKADIIRLAKKYGFVTPYTSFLAADDDVRISGGRPAPMPLQMTPMPAAAPSPQAAREAVGASVALRGMKSAEVAADAPRSSGRRVGAKTFQQKDGAWVDAEHDPARKLPLVELQFGSDALLRAIAADAQLAAYAALGRDVTVVHKGKVYRIRG